MSAKSSTFVVEIAYAKEIPTYREPVLRQAKKALIIKNKERIDI